jgi:hypothetical protein
MPESKDLHCPFLNRSDQRCSEMFNLDHLQHAFKFCFDDYHECPMYAQLLAERQGRRAFASARMNALHRRETGFSRDTLRRRHDTFVQVTIPARFARRQSAAA